MCDEYIYAQQLYLLPSGETPNRNKGNRQGCTIGEPCLDGSECTGGYCSKDDYYTEEECKHQGGKWLGLCYNVVPAKFQMLTKKNREPTQASFSCGETTTQNVLLDDGTHVEYPTQCFAPILNSQNLPSCGMYEKGSVRLPIPCNDALAQKQVNGDYYPLVPTDGGYPHQPDFVNCQDDPSTDASGKLLSGRDHSACRPFTFQTKIDPDYALQYSGKLNVFGYWGATNMGDFPDLTKIHPAYNQVIISFFHIAKYKEKLAIKCTMQGYGHESIWDEAPPWSVFPDGYERPSPCDEADADCESRNQNCCRWTHNGEGNPAYPALSIAKLIKDIQTWKSAARPDRPRTVLASFGGGSGANVTDPKGVALGTGAFTEKDIVKKDNFVQTVLDFLITWGFDGIDNDYEALGGTTCPIGAPDSDIRKNWEDLYSGLRACNPGIILTAAPFNNQYLGEFVDSGLFDEIRPQLYNSGGYQREDAKPSPQAPDGAADKWVGLLKNIGRSTKANGNGGYINVPGVLLEASCRSGSGSLKEQCWDMGRLANTLIYLNQQGEFGKEGKMMSVGVWDIAQGQRLTDNSFAAAMNVIIDGKKTQTPEQANLDCYYNKIFVDPCIGTNKCWADCGAKSGGRADGGEQLVDNHCDYWISQDGFCGQGRAYENGGIECGMLCDDCRTGDDADGGQAGKPCGAWCSLDGYCGTGNDYSTKGKLCGKPQPPQGQCTPEECEQEECGRAHPFLCTEGPAKNGCGSEDDWAGPSCSKHCDTRLCGGGGDLPQCTRGQFCPPERKGGPLIACPASGQCPYANPAQPLFLSNINI